MCGKYTMLMYLLNTNFSILENTTIFRGWCKLNTESVFWQLYLQIPYHHWSISAFILMYFCHETSFKWATDLHNRVCFYFGISDNSRSLFLFQIPLMFFWSIRLNIPIFLAIYFSCSYHLQLVGHEMIWLCRLAQLIWRWIF